MKKICKQCGEDFKTPASKVKFCSQDCYHKSRHKPPIVCSVCSETKKHCARGMCQECYRRVYNQKPENKERHAKQMRRWRKDNPEAAKAIDQRRQKTKHRKRWQNEYNRNYYVANAEALKQYQRDWRHSNPEQRDEYKRRYRARKALLPNTLTNIDWANILFRYNYCCAYCGDDGPLVKEHWIPASRGGGYTKDNIVPSCHRCNSRKATMTGDEFHQQLDIEEWTIIEEVLECGC